jgi:hypothetical protein
MRRNSRNVVLALAVVLLNGFQLLLIYRLNTILDTLGLSDRPSLLSPSNDERLRIALDVHDNENENEPPGSVFTKTKDTPPIAWLMSFPK